MSKVGMVVKEINYFHENESKTEKFSKIEEQLQLLMVKALGEDWE